MGNPTSFSDASGNETILIYDSIYRLTQIEYDDQSTVSFTYDLNSNRIRMDDDAPTTGDYTEYGYDSWNRLVTETRHISQNTYPVSCEYDAASRLTKLTYPDNMQILYSYDDSNRTTEIKRYVGNRTQKTKGTDTWDYTYDYANRLTRVEKNSEILGEYVYDEDGRRIEVTEDSITTIYVYFGADTLYEENTIGSAAHIYGPTGRIAKRTTINQESNIYYFHTDHLGSTRLVTDSSKNIVSAITYHPFGESYSEEGSENYLFNGKEKDETGLYYYGARYYDPELGRFLTRDPLGGALLSPQSLNRYTYCLNNPLKYVDPTGLNSRFSKDDEARADGKDEETKNRAKKHPPKQFHWPGDVGPPPIPNPGDRDRFLLFVTGTFWNSDGTMGIAVACIASPINSRFTYDSWAIYDFGLVLLFFDEDGNLLDFYFYSFDDLEDNMKEIWEEIKELLEEYGVSEHEFESMLEELTDHLDDILETLDRIADGLWYLGGGILIASGWWGGPAAWTAAFAAWGLAGAISIGEDEWDRWRDILEDLEDMAD